VVWWSEFLATQRSFRQWHQRLTKCVASQGEHFESDSSRYRTIPRIKLSDYIVLGFAVLFYFTKKQRTFFVLIWLKWISQELLREWMKFWERFELKENRLNIYLTREMYTKCLEEVKVATKNLFSTQAIQYRWLKLRDILTVLARCQQQLRAPVYADDEVIRDYVRYESIFLAYDLWKMKFFYQQ
jgi:hypothetical protein